MSIPASTAVWERSRADGAAFTVMLCLGDFANESGEAWPSIPTIARRCRISQRGARKAIRELEEADELTTTIGGGRKGSNRYILTPGGRNQVPGGSTFRGNDIPGGEELRSAKGGTTFRQSIIEPSLNHQGRESAKPPKHSTSKTSTLPEPEALPHGPDFAAAWGRWTAYRREKRKSLTPSTTQAQLQKLGKLSEIAAIGAIDRCILKGWQGLVFPDDAPNNGSRPKPEPIRENLKAKIISIE